MKYLVCDDSKMARKMLIKILQGYGVNVSEIVEASNGQEAVLKYEEYKPDLVFMDLTMPIMTGFEAIKIICEKNNQAKIIVISADIQENSMNKAKENGAIGFIKKPVSESSLKPMLEKMRVI